LNRTLSHEDSEEIKKGASPGWLRRKPYPGAVGLGRVRVGSGNRVKAFSLSRSDWVSQVRSGPGRVTGLRHFPYLVAIGLAGLG
jgi:hypothetical protein